MGFVLSILLFCRGLSASTPRILPSKEKTKITAGPKQNALHSEAILETRGDTNVKKGPIPATILIPDLFSSFLSIPPRVNPLYEEVRMESEAWFLEQVQRILRFVQCLTENRKLSDNEKFCKTIHRLDFAWFCSIAAPDAGKEELKTLCDWGNWVFPFDDLFDNGHLKDDTETAEQVLYSLMASIREGHVAEDISMRQDWKPVLVEMHDNIWKRLIEVRSESAPPYVQRRFAAAMEGYCEGILDHVTDFFENKTPDPEVYMNIRRRGVGVAPVFALIEYAHGIRMPEVFFLDPYIQELRRVGTDVVLIQNDILSYAKEESEGVPHNLITVLQRSGMSTQAAFDRAGEMLKECYRNWFLAQAEIPQFGEAIDVEVQKYVLAIRDVMTASLNWHYRTHRYFKTDRDMVRKNRMISVRDGSSAVQA